MNEIRKELEQDKAALIALRRDFHRHPELSLQEFRTAQRIEEELDRLDIPHTRVGETGVLGTLRGTGSGGGVMVLRADMDALPIQEANSVDCWERPKSWPGGGTGSAARSVWSFSRRRKSARGPKRLWTQASWTERPGSLVSTPPLSCPPVPWGSSLG